MLFAIHVCNWPAAALVFTLRSKQKQKNKTKKKATLINDKQLGSIETTSTNSTMNEWMKQVRKFEIN